MAFDSDRGPAGGHESNMALIVDSIIGGNRERDLCTGFSTPFRLTLAGAAIRDQAHVGNQIPHSRAVQTPPTRRARETSAGALSIGRYFTRMFDPSMNSDDVVERCMS